MAACLPGGLGPASLRVPGSPAARARTRRSRPHNRPQERLGPAPVMTGSGAGGPAGVRDGGRILVGVDGLAIAIASAGHGLGTDGVAGTITLALHFNRVSRTRLSSWPWSRLVDRSSDPM